ncbi:MAG: L-2-amino-thiazoline-4-carboxylic acid hydrolase [Chloroflexi bacterium]|nr:L-2-amino-thiazoline-4-carboxylic acid hydrolase [Chloroflexota bacterium]
MLSDTQGSSKDKHERKTRRGPVLTLAAVLLAGIVIARRAAAPLRMPFAEPWQRSLAVKRGAAEASRLIAAAETRYRELYVGRPRPASRALRIHLERSMLPGLALYQALLAAGDDRETALAAMDALCAESVTGLVRLMALLRRLPKPFAIFRRVEPWVVRLGFPEEGWGVEQVESSEDCVAFNVNRCFYLDTLTTYGAPELTRVFCDGDDVYFPALEPSIMWERTTTLGRGGDRCDFRWSRGASERREA